MAYRSHWAAVVTAAGSGSRFGGGIPKQFIPLGGRAVLSWSVDLLARLMPVTVAVPEGVPWRDHWTPPPGVTTVPGGKRRQDSVLAALEAVGEPRFVLVHDGARPGLRRETAEAVMDATEAHGAAIAALAVRDTLKRVAGGFVTDTVPREDLWAAQTPQGFRYDLLRSLLARAGDVTDESRALEEAGVPVAVVRGDPGNLKITEPEDLRFLGSGGDWSIGQGLDFHPFHEDRPMVAAGCRLGERGGPLGHSDGDAVLHAAADALLAAASLGDVGVFHPPSDPVWKNADSGVILRSCMERVRGEGWELKRLDLTLVGERPRVAPNREAMTGRVAEILEVPRNKVWIKGTTTNTLGDLGRGMGFGCLALAVLERRVGA